MNLPDKERILIGLVAKYGNPAAQASMPELTADKFIYDPTSRFGGGHGHLWMKLRGLWLNNTNPLLTLVKDTFTDAENAYLNTLVDDLVDLYHITDLDTMFVRQLTADIDKHGTMYRVSAAARMVGTSVESEALFESIVNDTSDVSKWRSEHFSHISLNAGHSYRPIKDIGTELRSQWEAYFRGENLPVVDCGMPSLFSHKLFPKGKLTVLHGQSGSGKSTFAFQYAVGMAIRLYVDNAPGCVAINSLEMPQDELVQRIAGVLAQVDVSKFLNGTITKEEHDRLVHWLDFAEQLPIFIDPTNLLTVDMMEYRTSGLHMSEHGPIVTLITDYGELFSDDAPSEELRVSSIFRKQFYIAHAMNIGVLAISQSTNDVSLTGKTFIAGVNGLRYSKSIRNAADVVVELWNPDQIEAAGLPLKVPDGIKKMPHIFVQKYRGAKIPITIPLGWTPSYTSFWDTSIKQIPGSEIVYTHLDAAVKKWSAW